MDICSNLGEISFIINLGPKSSLNFINCIYSLKLKNSLLIKRKIYFPSFFKKISLNMIPQFDIIDSLNIK